MAPLGTAPTPLECSRPAGSAPARCRVGRQVPGTQGAGSRGQAGGPRVLMGTRQSSKPECGPGPAPCQPQSGPQRFLCPAFSP